MAVEFYAAIDHDGVVWQAFTDEDGVLVIDVDAYVIVYVNRAVVGGPGRNRVRNPSARVGQALL
ncbi:hypothetical protein [Streptomyces sp. NPDC094468]|uniref:hypothetical protein n=1 Tax=Streptomyces sp. NPDC094468 TaxID=3366066 RepID=UPI0038120829